MASARDADFSTIRLLDKSYMDDSTERELSRSIPQVLVTGQRLPYLPDPSKTYLESAGWFQNKDSSMLAAHGSRTARANIAASAENPDGTEDDDWAKQHQHQTVSARLYMEGVKPRVLMTPPCPLRSYNNTVISLTPTEMV